MRIVLVAAALLTACGGSSGLTKAQLEEGQGLIHGFQPWEEAEPVIVGKLGAPAKNENDTLFWYAPDGDKCAQLSVQNMGGTVGTIALETVACP